MAEQKVKLTQLPAANDTSDTAQLLVNQNQTDQRLPVTHFLRAKKNLSDLQDNVQARANIGATSPDEVDNKIKNLFDGKATFLNGGSLASRKDLIWDDSSKSWYFWSGNLPKQVPAASSPQDTGGVSSGAWVSVGNSTLSSTEEGLGDALIGVKQPYAGAVARTQHDKNSEILSVKDFGAKGDGVTDDTNAIQKSFSYAKDFKSTILIPPGTYLVSDTIILYPKTVIIGSGRSSILKMKGGANKDILRSVNAENLWGVTDRNILDYAEQLYDLTLSDFVIDGGVTDWSSKPTGDGLAVWGSRLDISNIGIFNIAGRGIRTEFSDNAIPYQKQWIESSFSNIRVERCGMECWKFRGPGDAKVSMVSLLDGSRHGHALYNGLEISNNGATFANVHVSHDYNSPIGYVRHFAALSVSAPSSFVSGCQFEGASHANVLISGASNVNFSSDTNIYAAYSDCNIRFAGNISNLLLTGLVSGPMSTSSGCNGLVCDSNTVLRNSKIDLVMWGQEKTALVLGDTADKGGNTFNIESNSSSGSLYYGKLNTGDGSVANLKLRRGSGLAEALDSRSQTVRITAKAKSSTSVTYPLAAAINPLVMVQPVDASSDIDKVLMPVNVGKSGCGIYNPNSFDIDCYLMIVS